MRHSSELASLLGCGLLLDSGPRRVRELVTGGVRAWRKRNRGGRRRGRELERRNLGDAAMNASSARPPPKDR
jgi:hypothetical protein